jgi:predicted phage terminase large subunit-like protein
MDFPTTVKEIRKMNEKHPDRHSILIEDKANGSAIISVLQSEIPGIIAINPTDSKVSRVNAVTGVIESGNVYLPKNASFTDRFVEQFAAFPNGANDDLVDCASQALTRLRTWDANVEERTMEQVIADTKKKQLVDYKKQSKKKKNRRVKYVY